MYLVFDVGATTIKYALMSLEGDILEKGKVRTPVERGEGVEDFVSALAKVYEKYKGDVEGIAIGIPGQIDVDKGIVYNGGGIRYMDGVHLVDIMKERCDGKPVSVENDGKCAALAEVWKGNAKDVNDACVLVFGTGIGGALIKDKKIIHGKHLLAGEVSYIFEDMTRKDMYNLPEGEALMEKMENMEVVEKLPYTWATKRSTLNICHWAAKKKGLPDSDVTGEKLYQWAKEGDSQVVEILEEAYFSIAKQCLNIYVLFDPEIILIGGGISAEPEFVKGIQRYVNRLKKLSSVFSDIKIDCCRFYNDSNLLGALYNFKQLYT